jgi:MoxR-like ATPase
VVAAGAPEAGLTRAAGAGAAGGADDPDRARPPRSAGRSAPGGDLVDDVAGPDDIAGPDEMRACLAACYYLADDATAAAAWLALRMRRPLFLEGDPGVGKTSLAAALACVLGAPLIRLQCFEGIDAAQALYDWDFPRQLLHLRAVEAAATGAAAPELLERELYDRRFLLARPLLQALQTAPAVLLVDEIDRADDEFEAFLLELLGDFAVTIPELGTIRAETPPVVVLTSNRTRDVHDALKRRCLYHWLEHPSPEREVAVIRLRRPEASEALARQVAAACGRLRALGLVKPPGLAESLDWAHALVTLGADALDASAAAASLGTVVKYREDAHRVAAAGWPAVVGAAEGAP